MARAHLRGPASLEPTEAVFRVEHIGPNDVYLTAKRGLLLSLLTLFQEHSFLAIALPR